MEAEIEKQKRQFEKMTKEPVSRLLLTLSIPTIISMMVTNIYNIVDTAFVGTLGTSESGATGVVFGFMAILQAVAFMCGNGAGSIMSRRLGRKHLDEATQYASTGFFLSFSLGLLMAVISFACMTPLLELLGSTETIAPFARRYISCILLAAPFFTSSYTLNNLLRYEGKAKLGTVGMMTGAVLNICLDALLMFGFHLGITGAGLATAISQIVSFGILLGMFLRGKTQTHIALRYAAWTPAVVGNILGAGFPSLLRQGLNSVATMLLNRSARVYGDSAVAAMSIVARIGFFAMAVAIGIGQGFQPISSFNFGAGKKDRVRKAFWLAFGAAECVLAVASVPIFLFAPSLVRLLRDDKEVIVLGTRALRLMCAGHLFIPFAMMLEMGFQSTGAKLWAALSSSLRSGIIFIPTLLILARIRGMAGIQEAQPLSFVLAFVVSLFMGRVFLGQMKDDPDR